MKNNRRLEILLSPKDYELLRQKALDEELSVGELVREAIREKYGGASPEAKRAALQRLLRLRLPVTDWAKMEREITQGMKKRWLEPDCLLFHSAIRILQSAIDSFRIHRTRASSDNSIHA